MFLHIRTSLPITLNNKLTELKHEPSISKIDEVWSNRFEFNFDEYSIRIFFLSDILSWDLNEDAILFDNLKFLLVQGRKTKQLVLLHIDDEEQIERIKDKNLIEIIKYNTILISQNEASN
ncbi:hypothetical protein RZN25_17895 [Bacillaceae bacterium S4-13-56]